LPESLQNHPNSRQKLFTAQRTKLTSLQKRALNINDRRVKVPNKPISLEQPYKSNICKHSINSAGRKYEGMIFINIKF